MITMTFVRKCSEAACVFTRNDRTIVICYDGICAINDQGLPLEGMKLVWTPTATAAPGVHKVEFGTGNDLVLDGKYFYRITRSLRREFGPRNWYARLERS